MKTKISLLTILAVALLAGNAFAANVLLDVRTSFDDDNDGLVWTDGSSNYVHGLATGPTEKRLAFFGEWRQTGIGSVTAYNGSPEIALNYDRSLSKVWGATEVSFTYSNPTSQPASSWASYVSVHLNESINTSDSSLWGFDGSGSVFIESMSDSTNLVFGLPDTDDDTTDNIFNDFHIWVTDEDGYSFIIEALAFFTDMPGENGEVVQLESLQYNPAPTPIPGAAWLLGTGLLGLVGLRRRFKA